MNIDNFELYSKKVNQILVELDSFCDSIECESKIASKKGKKNLEVEKIVKKIKKINTKKDDENKATKEKTIAFLYQHAISFLPTDKISGGKHDSHCKKQ